MNDDEWIYRLVKDVGGVVLEIEDIYGVSIDDDNSGIDKTLDIVFNTCINTLKEHKVLLIGNDRNDWITVTRFNHNTIWIYNPSINNNSSAAEITRDCSSLWKGYTPEIFTTSTEFRVIKFK